MIVAMKKITLLVQSKDADSTIKRLRSLGMLHVSHQQAPQGKGITVLRDDIALIDGALSVLSQAKFFKRSVSISDKEPGDWKFTVKHIIDLQKRLDQLAEYTRNLQDGIILWERWGDFDPKMIQGLSQNNVYIRFYQIPIRQIKNLPPDIIVKELFTKGTFLNCVVVARGKINIPFKELNPPKFGLKTMRWKLSEANQIMASINEDIGKQMHYYENLLRMRKFLEKELEFHETLTGMGQSGSIMYLAGFVPYDAVPLLLNISKKERWGIAISDPSEDDRVPTLIRNPRWVSIINPIFKVVEIIPGYRELDISLWFLIFFSIFFGMLIGDAGYGSVFFILTLLARQRWGRRVREKSVFTLFYILSSCAIIWGGLTGTFFGQAWLPQSVKPLISALRSDRNVQALCFFLGSIHLSIAHLWRAIIKLPSFIALGEIGWIFILWGAFFLAKLLILGDPFPAFGKWYFIIGVSLVILFTSLKRNIFKGIGIGLGSLLLNLVNSFTDVVSYIRLFAVGLATVAVADSFNKMAMGIGYNSLITGLLTSFILLLGHILNILLGPMAVLVHGLRLNVLEFCNHLDIKWSGFPYQPLQEYRTDTN